MPTLAVGMLLRSPVYMPTASVGMAPNEHHWHEVDYLTVSKRGRAAQPSKIIWDTSISRTDGRNL